MSNTIQTSTTVNQNYQAQQTQENNQQNTTAVQDNQQQQEQQQAPVVQDTVQVQGNNNGGSSPEAAAIAQILAEANTSNMPIDKLAAQLKEKGYNVQVVEGDGENGKKHSTLQFLDKEGNVVKGFKDTSGDGQIGMQDSDFKAAVAELEKDPRYASIAKFLEVKEAETQAKKKLEDQYGNLGQLAALGALGNNFNDQDMAAQLQKIDSELRAKGYNGQATASDLLQMGQLEKVAEQYGVQIPQGLCQKCQNPYEKFMQLAMLALLPHMYGNQM